MDELELIRSFRRDDVKPNPVARAAARDRLLAHIADGPGPMSASEIAIGKMGGLPRRVSKGNIFICYRHEDSSAYAGWLADAIGRQFGKARVFRDVDSQRGVDFRDQVGQAIDSCAVLLAVIGPSWLMVQDESGRRRIDHPRDLVALEIAAALKRDIRVIPVLVAGARMPREADLPEQLAGLAYRTAVELSPANWDHQISGLVEDVSQVFESRADMGARAAIPSVCVIGDVSGPGRAPLARPPLRRVVASMQREAKFAYRLGRALLQLRVDDRPIRIVRDD